MQLAGDSSPKAYTKHRPRKVSPSCVVAVKDPVPSADPVLDVFAEDIVVDEIAHVVIWIGVEVAAGITASMAKDDQSD